MSTKLVMVRGKAGRFTAGSVVEDIAVAGNTRESWLNSALALIRTYLAHYADAIVPSTTRVSCGLAGGRIGAKRIGECWNTAASADGSTEIFISPTLDDVTGRQGVLATLVHEAIHAAVGVEHGHKAPFKRVAIAAGLQGKMTATEANDELMARIEVWAADLGNYPHARMNGAGRKKQSTRLVKVTCKACGYTLRTTQKWLDTGLPSCHCNGEPMSGNVEETEDSDSE